MLNSSSTDQTPPRTVLILGSPRSGTSWLAKILDTYANVLYLNEPLQKLRDPSLQLFVRRLLTDGELTPQERLDLLAILRETHCDSLTSPFFRKSFLRRSPRSFALLWLLRRTFHWSDPWFRTWCGVKRGVPFDLLIKEVDWLSHAEKIVSGLRPDILIYIIRHPCGVVNSRVRGVQMGVIHGHDRKEWLDCNAAACHELGYSNSAVEKMSSWEFYTLDWVLQNREYWTLAQKHARVTTLVYLDLCIDPLSVTEKVYDFLGWKVGAETTRFIRTSTSMSLRQSLLRRFWSRRFYYNVHKDSRQNATAWKRVLTADQQKAILTMAQHFEQFKAWFGGERADDYRVDLPETQLNTPLTANDQALLDSGVV